jgi:transposase
MMIAQSRSILVVDNASIHRGVRVQQLCDAFGVMLHYLPPYSPDYNPIEQSFKKLKSWLRRHSQEANMYVHYGYFLDYAVGACCYEDARGFYRHCGYFGNN